MTFALTLVCIQRLPGSAAEDDIAAQKRSAARFPQEPLFRAASLIRGEVARAEGTHRLPEDHRQWKEDRQATYV